MTICRVPQVETITSLKREYTKILRMIANEPVFLTQNGDTVMVAVSPQQWNSVVEIQQKEESRQKEIDKVLADAETEAYLAGAS